MGGALWLLIGENSLMDYWGESWDGVMHSIATEFPDRGLAMRSRVTL